MCYEISQNKIRRTRLAVLEPMVGLEILYIKVSHLEFIDVLVSNMVFEDSIANDVKVVICELDLDLIHEYNLSRLTFYVLIQIFNLKI